MRYLNGEIARLRVAWQDASDEQRRQQLLEEISELLRTVIRHDAEHAFGLTAQSIDEERSRR